MCCAADVESQRPPAHFPDVLRIGVLAGDEGDGLRLQAHFMHCEICREPALRLMAQVGTSPQVRASARTVSCAQARNAVFRYLEQGRELTAAEVSHLNACESCYDDFIEPARCARCDELEEDIPALD